VDRGRGPTRVPHQRAELARGDRRALYLGWLLCAQSGDFDNEEVEPPVPAGLAQLSASLESLVEFLRLDKDLIQVAATASSPLADSEPKPAEIRQWLARLPVAKKDDLLVRLLGKNEGLLVDEFLQQVRREGAAEQGTATPATERRTVAELLQQAEKTAEERRRIAAERAGQERARRERAAAIARAQHLDALAGRGPAIWKQVEGLIARKQPKSYDQAVTLLVDLRDIAARKGRVDFRQRVEELRAAPARKPTFIDRLQKAGL
jgi:predicted kinase